MLLILQMAFCNAFSGNMILYLITLSSQNSPHMKSNFWDGHTKPFSLAVYHFYLNCLMIYGTHLWQCHLAPTVIMKYSLWYSSWLQYYDAPGMHRMYQGVQRSGKSQGNSRLGKSQGKVREFCWRSGKKWILGKSQGKVREFAFSAI